MLKELAKFSLKEEKAPTVIINYLKKSQYIYQVLQEITVPTSTRRNEGVAWQKVGQDPVYGGVRAIWSPFLTKKAANSFPPSPPPVPWLPANNLPHYPGISFLKLVPLVSETQNCKFH